MRKNSQMWTIKTLLLSQYKSKQQQEVIIYNNLTHIIGMVVYPLLLHLYHIR